MAPRGKNVWQFLKTKHMMQQIHLQSLQRKNSTYIHTQKDLSVYVYSSFIHNGHKLETAQLSIHGMDKQTVLYAYNGRLPSTQKVTTTEIPNITDESQKIMHSYRNLTQKSTGRPRVIALEHPVPGRYRVCFL